MRSTTNLIAHHWNALPAYLGLAWIVKMETVGFPSPVNFYQTTPRHIVKDVQISVLDIVGAVYHLVINMQSNKIHKVF